MSDILLSVGLQKGSAEVSQIRTDLTDILTSLDKNPPKVKVGLVVDPSALNQFKTQVQQILNTLSAGNGSPVTINISGLGEVTAKANSAKAAMDGLAGATKNAGNESRKASSAAADAAKSAEKSATDALKKEHERQSLLKRSATLLTQMQNAEKNWTAAVGGKSSSSYTAIQEYIGKLQGLRAQFESGKIDATTFKAALDKLSTGFSDSSNHIKSMGENTKTVGDRLKGLASKFSAWFSVSQIIMMAVRAMRQMVKTSIELDDALTQMQIVTRSTGEEMEVLADKIVDASRRAAAGVVDMANAATTFARLGYDADESLMLAEYTTMLQNVGNIETQEAQDAITSIIKAFDVNVADIEMIMDKLVKTGNNFPISVSQIAEGMTNASSALAAAGNTFEQSVALLTAANTTVQDASKASTGLRTISARIRNTTAELDELGETMTEASYEELVQMLTDCNVALTDVNGEYRSTYDIMSDIAAQWANMTSMEQAGLATAMAGTRQQAVFYSIIGQFQEASGAMDAMADSAGTLEEAYDIYMNSASAHIAEFKTAWTELSTNIADSGLIKGIVDFGTAIVDILNGVFDFIDSIGGMRTVLLATATVLVTARGGLIAYKLALLAVAAVKKIITIFNGIKTGIVNIIQIIPNAITAWRAYAAGTVSASTAMQASIPIIGLVLAALTALSAGIALANSETDDASDSASEAAEKMAETRREMQQAADAASDYSDKISGLIMKYLNASDALDTLNGSVETYVTARDELIESLQIEQSELDALIKKYGSYEKAVASASLAKLQDSEVDLRLGVDSRKIGDNTEHLSASLTELADSEGNVYQDLIDEINAALDVLNTEFGADYVSQFWGTIAGIGSAKGSKFVVNMPQNDAPQEYTDMYGEENGKFVYYYEGYKKLIGELQSAGIGVGHPLYDGLVEQYNAIKEPVEAYLESVRKLNDNLAAQYVLTQTLATDGLPKTKSEFDVFRQGIIDSAVASGEFVGSVTDVENAVDGVLRSNPDFSGFYASADKSTQSLSALSDTVKKLKSNYDLLATAQAEMDSGEGLSPETIQAMAEETDRYLDYLYEENGVIKLNTDAWRAYSNEKMRGDIAIIEDEIAALQTERTTLESELQTLQAKGELTEAEKERVKELTGLLNENSAAIQANQNKLGIYTTLYGDITGELDAYSAALNNFSNIANAINSVADSLTTVADLQKEVANGFTMSLDKALEFAKVYPEILNGATVSADGQIALNRDVVNAFIAGKEAELRAQIDAQIAKIEADKAVLTAKMEFAKAQLELAKSVGTGEGQISKEVAEYRVNAGNAVAQALIAAGIDEATAYQLACAAMAQNSEEFNRVAAEVCTDVQGNFNQAAYDAAQAIYTNMQNSKMSIASVAAQAHEAAKAIAGIANGTVQGSSSIQGGGAGGAYTGKGNITVSSGKFEGTEYNYESKSISLEDFISDLELDISNYQKAISQMDGQIAALKALRNTSLDKLTSEARGGGGSNKNKEESWFEKEYALHQHLMKMDAEEVEDYLAWLNDAYQRAYNEGILTLDEYYKYQEEVYKGLQDAFKDAISDKEFSISMLERAEGNSAEILEIYTDLIQSIEAELARAYASGLDENDDYIQYLLKQWQSYHKSQEDMREDAESDAKSSIDKLVDYRIDMIKQEIEDEKDALEERLDNLKDFYDKQKEMLQDQYDEEKYLEEQAEKRKSVTDIQAELAMLEHDDSAWAQKRKLELQEELKEANKDLTDFEKEHALNETLDMLDEQAAAAEAQIQAEMDALEEKLNDPEALFNQALADIKQNTADLYQAMLEYNRKYGTGNDQDVIDMWEDAYKASEEYKDTHDGQSYNGIDVGNYTGYTPPAAPTPPQAPPAPTEPAPPAETPPATEPEAPKLTDEIKKKVAAAIWNGGYGWGTGSTRTNRLTEVFGSGNGIQALVNKGVGKSGVSLTSDYTYANMRKKFKGYASGTSNATPGWHQVNELGAEYLFVSPSDGKRYRMFTGGEKVLNANATDFLYDFANSGGSILANMLADLLKSTGLSSVSRPIQAIELNAGDIIVQGNANERTVSEIRRAQRSELDWMLKSLNALNK